MGIRFRLPNKLLFGLRVVRLFVKAALAVALASSFANAEGARPFKVGIRIDEVSKSFADAAKQYKAKMRADQIKCSPAIADDGKATCQYGVTGNIALVVTGAQPKSPADGLLLLGGKGMDGGSMLITMGLLMGVFDPEMDKQEKGKAVNKLLEALKTGEARSYNGRDARYKMELNELGLFFSMMPL